MNNAISQREDRALRVQSIEVNHFKSLIDFKFELAHFNCLIGLNGAGKSTVLQFLDFLSQLVRSQVWLWLEERKWEATEIRSKLTRKADVWFRICFANDNDESAGYWAATYAPRSQRCSTECFDFPDCRLDVEEKTITITDKTTNEKKHLDVVTQYSGSVLSALKPEFIPASIQRCRHFLLRIKSLELLNPEYLRRRDRDSMGDLGLGGQKLSAFLHELDESKKSQLLETLRKAYPQLQKIHAKSLRSGWKQLEIHEEFQQTDPGLSPTMITEARHINDGMLRLMAILAKLQTTDRFVLFDEIENGINPELIEFVVDQLVNANPQVLVTTHSPMILNYLDDETACAGVTYLYKTRRGHTKAMKFFDIPSMKKKLAVMGPGEAFVDTNLTELAEEISQLPGRSV